MNDERAARFEVMLLDYNDERDAQATVIDLLTDARHWCDRNAMSFADADRVAYQHYIAELAEGRTNS